MFNVRKISRKKYVVEDKNESFTVDIDGNEINLCFAIEIIDADEIIPKEHVKPITVTVNIFPIEDEVSDEYKKDLGVNEDYSHADALNYGSAAPVNPEVYNTSEKAVVKGDQLCFESYQEAQEFIEQEFPSQAEKIASMVGFHLDKPWNRIGDTGWDTLEKMT